MAARVYTPGYLTERHFAIAIGIACALHAAAMVAWALSPREQVIDIPVRILNIKLGDEELPTDMTQPGSPPISNAMETALTRQLETPPVVASPHAPAAVAVKNALPPKAAAPAEAKPASAMTQAKQFIRSQPFIDPQAGAQQPTGGSALGNSIDANAETDAQVEANYGMQISLWLDRFKIYPAIPKTPGVESVLRKTVIIIRLDRRGNVRYFDILQSSGNATIDQATRDMVRNANPFPPAPDRFKAGKELLEFNIPIHLTF